MNGNPIGMEQRVNSGLSSEVRMVLSNYSSTDLENLLSKQQNFSDLLKRLPCVMGLEASVALISEETERLAVANLSKETVIEETRQDVSNLRQSVADLQEELFALRERHQKLIEKTDLFTIHEEIRNAVIASDQSSEEVAESFLNGGIELEKFLPGYLGSRKLSHLRRAKGEKLRVMIEEHEDDYR
ncbi:unnamed protein product [Notodromas monacha]|uniref:VPS37 C-terminal domain-containing protein n=1 Tax=Notodromas monacha TaxID=399045 RepID=A0A7R9G9F9_9CRUS|nr:unnamed protein product [Notodromas monacha]CAG0914167.1 unnamed protein product [Notodromas monacha]